MLHRLLLIIACLAWGIASYAMLRANARRELAREDRMPLAIAAILAGAASASVVLLPAPFGGSVGVAVAGFGVASWGDWNTSILWDEIVVGTLLLAGGLMIAGGQGIVSLEGGVFCGAVMYALYFGALLCGRETGFGDVKLAAGIGFALGPWGGLVALVGGACAWLVLVLVWARIRNISFQTLRMTPFAFGPALTAGLAIGACCIGLGGMSAAW